MGALHTLSFGTRISFFFFFSFLLGGDSSYEQTKQVGYARAYAITRPIVFGFLVSPLNFEGDVVQTFSVVEL